MYVNVIKMAFGILQHIVCDVTVHVSSILCTHLLQTDNPQILMERNNASTDFMSAMISYHRELFPARADEKPAKRLRFVNVHMHRG